MSYINKQTIVAAILGFLVGISWYQITAWFAGIL